jgi:hypothetical protein
MQRVLRPVLHRVAPLLTQSHRIPSFPSRRLFAAASPPDVASASPSPPIDASKEASKPEPDFMARAYAWTVRNVGRLLFEKDIQRRQDSDQAIAGLWELCSRHTVGEELNVASALPDTYPTFVCLFSTHLFLVVRRVEASRVNHAKRTREHLLARFKTEHTEKIKLMGV